MAKQKFKTEMNEGEIASLRKDLDKPIKFEKKHYVLVSPEEIKDIIELLHFIYNAVTQNNSTNANDEWLNNEQVKAMLGVSTRTLFEYRTTGILQHSQHKRKIYYKRSVIIKYLNDHHIKF